MSLKPAALEAVNILDKREVAYALEHSLGSAASVILLPQPLYAGDLANSMR
jgi:hypothetical protein